MSSTSDINIDTTVRMTKTDFNSFKRHPIDAIEFLKTVDNNSEKSKINLENAMVLYALSGDKHNCINTNNGYLNYTV